MLIAFDIDGTLADITHRLHFVKRPPLLDPEIPFKKDWDAFFANAYKDEPIKEMINLLGSLALSKIECEDLDIIFVTGRSDICRKDTIQWLLANTLVSMLCGDEDLLTDFDGRPLLYMRKQGDYRPDYSTKLGLLIQIEDDYGKAPDIVFDDRKQVVDMWRERGIRCCQVAKGEF